MATVTAAASAGVARIGVFVFRRRLRPGSGVSLTLIADVDHTHAHVVAFAAVLRTWIDRVGVIRAMAPCVPLNNLDTHSSIGGSL